MEPIPIRSEPSQQTTAQVLALELDGNVVMRCDDRSCEVCGPVLEAAA